MAALVDKSIQSGWSNRWFRLDYVECRSHIRMLMSHFKENASLCDKAPERQRQEGENKESNIVSDSPIRVYTATMLGQEDQKRLNQGGTAQSSVLRYIKNLRFLSKSFQLLARPRTPLWKLFEQLPFFPKAQLQSRLDVVSDWLKYWFLPQGHVAQPSIRRS